MSKERSGRGFGRIAAIVTKRPGDLGWTKKQERMELKVWIFVQHVSIHVVRIVCGRRSAEHQIPPRNLSAGFRSTTLIRSSAKANEDAKSIQQLVETEFPSLRGKTDEMWITQGISQDEYILEKVDNKPVKAKSHSDGGREYDDN